MYTYRARVRGRFSGLPNGVVSVVNRIGSGKKVTLFRFVVRNQTACPNAAADIAGVEELVPITATSGGSDISYFKLDSTNADLPSQVLIREMVSDITTNASSTVSSFLRRSLLYRYNNARGAFPTSQGGGLDTEMGDLCASPEASDLQHIVLREGEGIAWRVSSLFWSNYYRIHCIFRTASGASYCVDNEYNFSQSNECTFVLFNGSGSGVVLYIDQITVEDCGDDTIPTFFVIPIDEVLGGNEVDVIPMDTNNPAVPSTIKVVTDGAIITRGILTGARDQEVFIPNISLGTGVTQWKYYWDRTMPGARYTISKHILSGVNPGQSIQFFQAFGGDFDPSKVLGYFPVILREGEGVTLIQGQPDQAGSAAGLGITYKSSRFNYSVVVMFGIEDETTIRKVSAYAPLGSSPRIGVI